MRTAAVLPAQIPAPALALAAVPALVTVAYVGVLLFAASDLQRSGSAPDSFQLWKDRSGVVWEMKLVGLRHEPGGSEAQFITRDGLPVSHPIADLQRADQARAWDAAFALDPVLSFREATLLKADTGNFYEHYYHLTYSFEASVLPIHRIVENSIRINHVPIEGLHGPSLLPSAWTVNLKPHDSSSRLCVEPDRLDFSTSGYLAPSSLKGALAEGSLTAICVGDLAEGQLAMAVPAHPGLVSKANVGPFQLSLTTSGTAPELRKLALEVSGGSTGQLAYAGFHQEGPRADVRSTYIAGKRNEIVISTGYYRKVKAVEVPFSGMPE